MKEQNIKIQQKEWALSLREKSADFLCEKLKKYKPENILEIGTYLGGSGLLFLKNLPNARLTTIEIDKERFEKAKKNFEDNGVLQRALCLNGDAFDVIKEFEKEGKKFDFIFLDGPKGQYIKYLPILKKLLSKNANLFVDNIFFHGLVKAGYPKHKHRTIVFRLREFIETMQNDKDFQTQILDLEDGIMFAKLIVN